MHFINVFIFLFSAALLFSNCKKEEEKLKEQLPSITTEGKMTFACIIKNNYLFLFNANGVYEAPVMGILTSCKGGTYMEKNNDEIVINARNCGDYPSYKIVFDLKNTFKVNDEIKIGKNTKNSCHIFASEPKDWSKADSAVGSGIIKILRADSILSGLFYISTFTDENFEVKLTEGRFDLKFE